MARQYGRIPRGGGKAATPAEPSEIRIVIAQNYTWEQFALEAQRAFHQVQEYGATGLIRFRAQLMPLDENGKPMTLYDQHGQPVTAIHIPEPPQEKPYRDNEPGVGVMPAAKPRTPRPSAAPVPSPASSPLPSPPPKPQSQPQPQAEPGGEPDWWSEVPPPGG